MRVLVRSRLETPSPPNIVRRDEIVGHELGMPGHRASTYRRGPRHPAVRRAIPAGGSAMMSDEPVGEGYLAGQILIAMPSMSDPRFARTVIYLCAHHADGAMGLVLNQIGRASCRARVCQYV